MRMSKRNEMLIYFQNKLCELVSSEIVIRNFESSIVLTKEEITNALHHVQLTLTNG